MNSAPINDPVILGLKKRLVASFSKNIRKILLFGSRARGDFQPSSDYDVIVLVDKAAKSLEERICNAAWDFGFEHYVSISVLVFEQALFENDSYEPLFMNVRREGVAV